MECERCNENLSAYADGVLSRRDASQVKAHIDTCRRCREDLSEFRTLTALLRATADPEPRPAFWAETYTLLREQAVARPRRSLPLRAPGLGWGVALAALLIVALLVPPRRINLAQIPPTSVSPAALVSLHARLRSDLPLADSASLHYALVDADGTDESFEGVE